MIQGINYVAEGNSNRGRMLRYHEASRIGLPFRKLNKTEFERDLTHLPRATRDLTTFTNDEGEFQSKFSIGFEIEKNSFHRGAVKEYPLFSHFEYDSSCGVEAVTNLLPLVDKSVWRNKVLGMFSEASKIIEDRYSPSNQSCGGHITLSCVGMSGQDLADKLRPYSGIIYALWRFRLRNSYCYGNLMMNTSEYSRDWVGHTSSSKYHVCKIMDDRIEFRLPTRVESVRSINLRYRLMYELMNYAINKPNGTYAGFIKKIKSILLYMYDGNEAKVDEIINLSKSFRKMLMSGKINAEVVQWVDQYNRLSAHYTTSLRRATQR